MISDQRIRSRAARLEAMGVAVVGAPGVAVAVPFNFHLRSLSRSALRSMLVAAAVSLELLARLAVVAVVRVARYSSKLQTSRSSEHYLPTVAGVAAGARIRCLEWMVQMVRRTEKSPPEALAATLKQGTEVMAQQEAPPPRMAEVTSQEGEEEEAAGGSGCAIAAAHRRL